MVKLLFFAGSARKDSINKKLAKLAANMAQKAGAQVTYIDLKDFEMPLYDGDLEAQNGIPENAKKLKQVFVEHDGFFIASPEYNSSMSALLKNSLDWISRPHEQNEAALIAFKGKVAALGSVSPGGLGGLRGLVPLRMMLGNIGVTVVPSQTAINSGFQAFDDNEQLKNENQAEMLKATIDEFVKIASRMNNLE
ncbi:NADPH-dependent FMN reductase [Candidatus Marithrix sp. Canyon 246]|uniref:NADPH-dependent FMN reductase n=1 Tax=Candidatus Marithrix sp. Canyon 246 TaxID=1827136 RepID=UPI000849F51A|nr:NAD(P)H-dependent oxidoreductase [Candidatus Marithrix sp. Canyon 246]